jgi:hypothetical protein
MRSSQRLYSIQEVASLTYKSVGITKICAAKLGLGKKYPNREGVSFIPKVMPCGFWFTCRAYQNLPRKGLLQRSQERIRLLWQKG